MEHFGAAVPSRNLLAWLAQRKHHDKMPRRLMQRDVAAASVIRFRLVAAGICQLPLSTTFSSRATVSAGYTAVLWMTSCLHTLGQNQARRSEEVRQVAVPVGRQ